MLESLLFHSGAEYKQSMEAELAQQMSAGQQMPHKYPVVVASEMVWERTVFIDMHSLVESKEAWKLLPSEALTVFERNLAFRLVSRACGAVYQLMQHENKTFPIKAFTILNRPELASSLDGFKGDWPELVALAEKTILKANPKTLLEARDAMNEADKQTRTSSFLVFKKQLFECFGRV
eukprot:568065-Amphidinium_carterae.1